MVHTGSYVTSAKPVTLGQSAADALTEITNRAALALLEHTEARRHANEELPAAATDVIEQAVYGNRAEAYQTALRIVARALPAIVAEARTWHPPDGHNGGRGEDSAMWASGELTEAWGK